MTPSISYMCVRAAMVAVTGADIRDRSKSHVDVMKMVSDSNEIDANFTSGSYL